MSEVPHSFSRLLRITTPQQFQEVFDAHASVNVGPLRVHGCPNGLRHPRMGMAVSRRVGNAVVRNRNKRLLREAFRQVQHELPAGYDLVISMRSHTTLSFAECCNLLLDAAKRLEGIWKRRQRNLTAQDPATAED